MLARIDVLHGDVDVIVENRRGNSGPCAALKEDEVAPSYCDSGALLYAVLLMHIVRGGQRRA